MDKEVYEVRLANWKQLILQCRNRPAGMTQKDWLEQHDIKAPQFYYWLRKVRREALAEMAGTDHKEVVPASMAGYDLEAPVTFAEIDLNKAQLYTESHYICSARRPLVNASVAVTLRNLQLSNHSFLTYSLRIRYW